MQCKVRESCVSATPDFLNYFQHRREMVLFSYPFISLIKGIFMFIEHINKFWNISIYSVLQFILFCLFNYSSIIPVSCLLICLLPINFQYFIRRAPAGRSLRTQPDGGAYQDCTMLRVDSGHSTAHWHDIPCSLGKLAFHNWDGIDWGDDGEREILSSISSYICKMQSDRPIGKKTISVTFQALNYLLCNKTWINKKEIAHWNEKFHWYSFENIDSSHKKSDIFRL